MKVNNNRTPNLAPKKNASSPYATESFHSMLEAQVEHDTHQAPLAPTQEQVQQQQSGSKKADVEASMVWLEQVAQQLDTKNNDLNEVQAAVKDLRRALHQSSSQSPAKEEAETMLAVEEKRLERLQQTDKLL
ncbi:MAG: hypothetical protein AUK35_00765 [Zetaproteobacteria bacterium CG2_30_46_52]|nr:MAG: hypothetical protein AUK35_00765 [Zetaproteobacteria bacterium CG2_30_46_52]